MSDMKEEKSTNHACTSSEPIPHLEVVNQIFHPYCATQPLDHVHVNTYFGRVERQMLDNITNRVLSILITILSFQVSFTEEYMWNIGAFISSLLLEIKALMGLKKCKWHKLLVFPILLFVG